MTRSMQLTTLVFCLLRLLDPDRIRTKCAKESGFISRTTLPDVPLP
jgi:hypothetical protein